ncbi:MAG: hypothetical protein KAJ03_10550 [Gammaproteobacteria bacterium]|nr:hypothetical protein [Gammaproteobacteria bacterium]
MIETYSASQIIVMAIGTIVATVGLYHAGKILGDKYSDIGIRLFAGGGLFLCGMVGIGLIIFTSQLGAVDVFDAKVKVVAENVDYNTTPEQFIASIDTECGKIDDVDIYGIIKYDERDCNRMVFKRTEEKYMFLNGVTP